MRGAVDLGFRDWERAGTAVEALAGMGGER